MAQNMDLLDIANAIMQLKKTLEKTNIELRQLKEMLMNSGKFEPE